MDRPFETQYVVVLNQIYAINLVPGLAENQNCDGVCDDELKTIEVDADLPLERMQRVLLHELIHAYCNESGLGEFIERQAEEMLCQSLSGFLNGIMEWKFKTSESEFESQ